MYNCQDCLWTVVNHTISKLFRYLRTHEMWEVRVEMWPIFWRKLRLFWAKQHFTLSCGYINHKLYIVRADSHAVSYPGFVFDLYLFIYLFLLFSCPSLFSSSLFLKLPTHISTYRSVCFSFYLLPLFLCSWEPYKARRNTVAWCVFFFHNSEEISNSRTCFKKANWQIFVVLEINLWQYFRLGCHAIWCCKLCNVLPLKTADLYGNRFLKIM